MVIKIAIQVKKMVNNFKYFRVNNINEIKKPVLILFRDNKTYIQFRKSIFNIKKIKHINSIFYKVKDKSKKNIIFLK